MRRRAAWRLGDRDGDLFLSRWYPPSPTATGSFLCIVCPNLPSTARHRSTSHEMSY